MPVVALAGRACSRIHPAHAGLPARARTQQPPRVVPRAQGTATSADVRAPMVGAASSAWRRDLAGLRAGSRGACRRRRIYRPYRDTRFTRRQVAAQDATSAAVFPHRRLPEARGRRASISRSAPAPRLDRRRHLHAVERQLLRSSASTSPRTTAASARIVECAGVPARVRRRSRATTLQRVPRGFPPDHPAAEFLKLKQFLRAARAPRGVRDGRRTSTGQVRRGRSRRSRRSSRS
ncbi:MAG: DUF2461 domain-containing protein [Comamonadaceae bacterium]|nr:DUF2461 domain-containing protein [Comamonadaceae bacterium]